MATIKIKGHAFEALTVKDAFNRRAQQFKNTIIASLRRLGITEDDIDIELEQNTFRKSPASVSWYMDHQHLHYSHNSRSKYVENLFITLKVIDLEISALLEGNITLEEFIREFSEDTDVAETRKEARAVLGLEPSVNDLQVIDKAYKGLAKKHHPDTEHGDIETFKKINHAHKILRRELL